MRFAKDYPIFTATIAVFILIFIGGGAFGFMAAGQADDARKKLKRTQSQLESLLVASPAPTDENLVLAEKNKAALQSQLDKRMAATKGKMPNFASRSNVPASPSEMFFELEAYRKQFIADAMRISKDSLEEAAANGDQDPIALLQLPEDEDFAFGFSRYLKEPPEDKYIETIHRQKEILTYVLRKLYNSKPHSIVSVLRESVIEQPVSNNRNLSKDNVKKDEFVISENLSSAVEGAVETFAFRVDFTGYSNSLRNFMIQLESFDLPLVVRSVEVKPIEAEEAQNDSKKKNNLQDFFGLSDDGENQEAEVSQEPIVGNNISEYSVVIEYIQVHSANFNIAQSGDGELEDEDS